MQNQSVLDTLLFNNIIPIITTLVVAIVFVIRLESRIDLLSQKVDIMIQEQQSIIQGMDNRLTDVENRQRDGLQRLAVLESKVNHN